MKKSRPQDSGDGWAGSCRPKLVHGNSMTRKEVESSRYSIVVVVGVEVENT